MKNPYLFLSKVSKNPQLFHLPHKNLPKSQILRELDDNIHKYAKEEISDNDIIRVATRITNKQLQDIEELNSLAENDKIQFVKRLEEEAAKQRRIEESRLNNLQKAFKKISFKTAQLEKTKDSFDRKKEELDKILKQKEDSEVHLKAKLLDEQNKNREIQREEWINWQVYKWRKQSWIELLVGIVLLLIPIIYILYISRWDISVASEYLKKLQSNILIGGIISILFFLFSVVSFNTLIGKYRNHSNIENYKKALKVPEDLKELKKPVI